MIFIPNSLSLVFNRFWISQYASDTYFPNGPSVSLMQLVDESTKDIMLMGQLFEEWMHLKYEPRFQFFPG